MSKIGRNDPCHCGSGKKYKKCCLRSDGNAPSASSWAQVQAEVEELDNLSNSVPEMLRAGRFREAEEVCQRLMIEYPDQVDGLERFAMTCAAQGRKKEAAEWYRKTVEFMRSHEGFDEEAVAWPLDKAKRLEAELGVEGWESDNGPIVSRKKKARSVDTQLVLGAAWYTPHEWEKVRRDAVDPDRLEDTFEEWEAMAEDTLKGLQAQDKAVIVRRVPINAAALVRWCLAEGRENNGAARAAFARTELIADSTPSTATNAAQSEPK